MEIDTPIDPKTGLPYGYNQPGTSVNPTNPAYGQPQQFGPDGTPLVRNAPSGGGGLLPSSNVPESVNRLADPVSRMGVQAVSNIAGGNRNVAGGASLSQVLGAPLGWNSAASLQPGNNQYLQNTQAYSDLLARGQLRGPSGEAAAQGAAGAMNAAGMAGQAAGGIAPASQRLQGMQDGQLGQYGADAGIVRDSAMGKGPSAAEHLAKSQLDNNIRAQMAMAGSARGGNLASAQRGAQATGAGMMQQATQQIAAQRAQEQLNAQQILGTMDQGLSGAIGNARGQDVLGATNSAGAYANAANSANGAAGAANNVFGTNAGLTTAGLQGMGNSAGLYGQQAAQANSADLAARQMYAQGMLGQVSAAGGVVNPAGAIGTQNAMSNTNHGWDLFGDIKDGVGKLFTLGMG